jgi:hypothetical protein
MKRAIQTAIGMFKNHPNMKNINFQIVPQCHEFTHTTNDLPMDVYKLIEEYKPGSAASEGLHFDFTWLLHYAQPQLWSILSLWNPKKQALILS